MTLRLNVIVTSVRPGRNGPKVGKWVADFARKNSDFEVEFVDLADYELPMLDEPNHPMMQDYQHEHTKRWSEVNAKADAFVFVSPEYNYFPAASTVNAIQTLHKEWHKKPVGLVGYGGVSGGMRAMQSAKILMTTVSMMPGKLTTPPISHCGVDCRPPENARRCSEATDVRSSESATWPTTSPSRSPVPDSRLETT